ncbi:MAG: carbonic anhydrase [Flammeovirgaceae bacterium]|nr:carbonic anhydrase [Flammeovirgaceae bacterium]MBE63045.1 carbonic anhydrase [Flammeovirgaceae bacterium]MBR07693.1 carbonic anhydrase [Rickettsiales bacterium]|tara:strand:- start:5778 stop:6497 length:720 start_codon:yes stop_codon:yes gene_type:complete
MHVRSIILVLVVFLNACTSSKKAEDPYVIPDLDHGLHQSPINIITDSLTEGNHQIIADYKPSHEEITHLRNTVEVEYDSGSFLSFDGVRYECKQFHFHTPAEHLIDGITYPMEVHLVHTNLDSTQNHHYFVISMLFRMGRHNDFLQDFIDRVPEAIGDTAHFDNAYFDLSELVNEELRDYYHYTGSLTTSPYTETVHWAVSNHILEASPDQIARLNKIEGNNARHIHSINGRKLEFIHQ